MKSPGVAGHPFVALCLILGLSAVLSSASAQDYVFTKVVDNNDPIPNGAGALFSIVDPAPALDAGTVVFRNGPGALAPTSIWSVTNEGAFTKLVDLNTAVPGGTGVFTALIIDFSAPGYPVLSAGTAVFAGRDSAVSGYTGGIYSVPTAGGTITRIANRNVVAPGGGNFEGGLQYFAVDAGKVAFNGVSSGGSITGIYSAGTNGSSLVAIADSMNPAHPEFPFPIGNFAFPSISGTTVAFYGNGVFDPSTGYNALYTSSTSGGFAYGEPATSGQALPGDPTAVFHTRFGSPRIDGSTIFFRADDANTNPNFFGLFSVPSGGGAFSNLVDVNAVLPGLTTINNNSFTAYAAGDGLLAFTALDGADHYGLYTHDGVAVAKVIATGDSGPYADLHATIYAPSIGSQAVSNGELVLMTGVRFSGTGIFRATPFALSADLAPAMSLLPANASVGADVVIDLDLPNNGPATAQSVTLIVTLPVGLDFKNAAGGVYDANARTVTFSAGSIASGALKSFTVIATVNVDGPLTASAYANSAPTADSNRLNNHVFATTNSIFASNGNWVIRPIVINNVTPVPDRPGEFFVTNGGLDPLAALDGGKVAFIAVTGSATSVWSVNADGSGGFTRLADTETALPGGAGEKFGYMKSLRLRNGNVVFLGFGADGVNDGIYSVPVTGGTLKAVAVSGSPRPEGTGTNFGYQDFIQNFSYGFLGEGQMTFVAQSGLYAYPAAGDGMGRVVVYPGSNIPVAGNAGTVFSTAPAISGTRVVWEGSGGGDATLESYLDEHRFAAIADIATESPTTPGENFVYSTQFSFAGAQVEGETVVFRAFSGAGATLRGIYSITSHGPAAPANSPVSRPPEAPTLLA